MNGTFQNCSCSAACALGAGPCCDEKSMMAARAEAASLRADPARACGSADNDHALADATSKRDMQTLKSTLALAAKLINGLPVRRLSTSRYRLFCKISTNSSYLVRWHIHYAHILFGARGCASTEVYVVWLPSFGTSCAGDTVSPLCLQRRTV